MKCHVALWHNGQSHEGIFEIPEGVQEDKEFSLSSTNSLGSVSLTVTNVRKASEQVSHAVEALIEATSWMLGMGWNSEEEFLRAIGFDTRNKVPAWYSWA